MVANNAYAAYQKFAKKPITRSIEEIMKQKEQPNTVTTVPEPTATKADIKTNANATNHYLQNAVFTAAPEDLTFMLYNGAIKFINQAIAHIEEKNIEKSHQALIKAQNIFYELSSSLDMKYELSENLKSIYTYIIEGLGEANMGKSVEKLREIIPYIVELKDTWSQAMKSYKKEIKR